MNLKKFDNLFGEDEVENIEKEEVNTSIEIDIDKLEPYSNHQFRLYEGEQFEDMVKSIQTYGVLTPILVRAKGDKFEILSGHNRVNVSKHLGLTSIVARIMEDINNDTAELIVSETNLLQRGFSDLSYSERAIILKNRHNILKKQGIRKDLIDDIESVDGNSNEMLAEKYNLSATNISRYLKLAELDRYYLDLVDNDIMPFTVGVELAYLSKETLDIIKSILDTENVKIDIKKSKQLREIEKDGKATQNNIEKILKGEKKVKDKKVKVPGYFKKVHKEYFENCSEEEIEQTLREALELYFNK